MWEIDVRPWAGWAPHEGARERDADFHVPARDLPSGYTALYCRQCIGELMIIEAVFSRGHEVPRGAPATIEYEVLSPTREPW
jgi:hypothetical protein